MQIDRFLVVASIIFILAFAGCSRQQEKPVTASSSAATEVLTATTVLASIANDDISQVLFSETGSGVAYLARKNNGNISVVHNGKAGKEYAITIGQVVLSADGRHVAYGAMVADKWCMVVDGREGRPFNSVISPVFSSDGQHIAYQAMEGEKWHIVVDNRSNSGTKTSYSRPVFSADSTLIAYVENQDKAARLIVSDLRFNKQRVKENTGELLVSNKNRTRLAATKVVDNKVRVIDFNFATPDVVHEGRLYDAIHHMTFGDDGVSVAYVAEKGGTRLLVLDDREESLPAGELVEQPVIHPDKQGVGVLLASKNGSFLHQSFIKSTTAENMYDEAANLVYSKDSRFFAYVARKGKNWFVVVNGKEGPQFDRVVAPVFSPDGKRLVYRARKNEKRFLVEADTTGKTIKRHPAYEQVFQPVFTADGKSVVYGVKDGNKLICRVEGR